MFRDHKYDQIGRYIAEHYIGHTPEEPNGREALRQVIPTWFEGATVTLQIVRKAAEGDLVWLHIHYMLGEDIAVVDIMRIEYGKIAKGLGRSDAGGCPEYDQPSSVFLSGQAQATFLFIGRIQSTKLRIKTLNSTAAVSITLEPQASVTILSF